MPGTESMRVVLRIRPESAKERKKETEEDPLFSILDSQVLIFDPKVESAPTYFHGQKINCRNMSKRKAKDFKCVFDSVQNQLVFFSICYLYSSKWQLFCSRFCTQQEVFEASALDVVKSVVDGYNGSVFAYGATGAGKTHTMLGSIAQPGVIYRTMKELYRLMGEREDTHFELSVSYMEIYNETIRDLFSPGRALPLREDDKGAVAIAGLSFKSPESLQQIYDMLLTGTL